MAASLVPEELTEAEDGPLSASRPRCAGNRASAPCTCRRKLPDGYEMFGQLIPQPLGSVKATQLTYMRTRGKDCHFYLRQAARGERFPNVAAPALVSDGVTLKTALKPPLRPADRYTTIHFKVDDVWFGMTINPSTSCEHSLEMVAEVAMSMVPLWQ